MADLVTPLSNAGSQTEPSKLTLTLPSASGKTWLDAGLPFSFADLADLDGAAMADGVNPIRHCVGGSIYETSLLPPSPHDGDMTATPSGAQATATLNLNAGNIGNGDTFYISPVGGGLAYGIKAMTTLSASRPQNLTNSEVLVGASDSETLDNLKSMLEADTGDPLDGSKFWHHTNLTTSSLWRTFITVSSKTATTVGVTFIDFGTSGNAYHAYLASGFGGGESLGSTGTTVGTVGYFENGSDGSGTAPGTGDYRYIYTNKRTADSGESGPSEVATASQGTAQNINLAAMDDPIDADADFKTWYRTLTQGVEFYRGADVPDGTTTDTDDKDDDDLVAFGQIPYDESAHRTYYSGVVPKYRVLASWRGRLWGAGAILSSKYTAGDCDIDNDSVTVTLQNGAVAQKSFIGRSFRATDNNDAETYLIVAVSESAGTIKLNRPYQGASRDPASYEIVDNRDVCALACSEPGLINQWPEDNELTGVTSDDPRGITGLMPFGDALFIFTVDGIWRLTGGDITSWQLTKVVDGVGCVAPESLRTIPGGMIWLGRDGIFAYAGSGQPERISSPATQGDRVTGIDGTIDRINWPHVHQAHGLYGPSDRTYRVWVPLDDAVAPSHAIVLDMGTRGTFSLDDSLDITYSAMARDASGDPVPLLGDLQGYVFQYGTAAGAAGDYHIASAKDQDSLAIPTKGTLKGDFTSNTARTKYRIQKRGLMHGLRLAAFVGGDGAFGFEPVQSVSSATARTITVGSSVFPTTGDGLDGIPVWVVRDTGSIELAKVASNTGTVLTLTRDLAYTPDSNDQIFVGGIFFGARTGRWDLGETRRFKSWLDLWVTHSPGNASFLGYEISVRARDEVNI